MSKPDCPALGDLVHYYADALPREREGEIERHAALCEMCDLRLSAVYQISDELDEFIEIRFLERHRADLRAIQRALHRIVKEGAPFSVADKIGTLERQVGARLKELDKSREARSEG
jgi:hypothetical protein